MNQEPWEWIYEFILVQASLFWTLAQRYLTWYLFDRIVFTACTKMLTLAKQMTLETASQGRVFTLT